MKENYVYPVKIEASEDGVVITAIDFENTVSCAESKEEAIQAAQELLAITIMDYESQEKEVPKPTITEERDVIYIHIWMPYFKNISKEKYIKKSVTVPEWLDILAKNNNVNFSAAMVRGIKQELGIGGEK